MAARVSTGRTSKCASDSRWPAHLPVSPPSGTTRIAWAPIAVTARATQGPCPPTFSATSGSASSWGCSNVQTSTGAGAKTATRPAPAGWWLPVDWGLEVDVDTAPEGRNRPGQHIQDELRDVLTTVEVGEPLVGRHDDPDDHPEQENQRNAHSRLHGSCHDCSLPRSVLRANQSGPP